MTHDETPEYSQIVPVIPRLEKALGIWITPTLGFTIDPNPPGYVFPLVKQVFDGYLTEMRHYADEVKEFIFSPKLNSITNQKSDGVSPYWENDYFQEGDARLAYAVIARYRPKLIIEIGCGNSTKFMRRAINDYDTGSRLVCIDPAPREEIDSVAHEIHRVSCTQVDVQIFSQLSDGDVLFVDGSHLVMNGSDCVHLFLNILPSLKTGVWVHFHDIFLPYDYAYDLHVRCRFNEQYLLAMLFLYSKDWLPALPIYFAYERQLLPLGGGSFWMKKIGRTGWPSDGSESSAFMKAPELNKS